MQYKLLPGLEEARESQLKDPDYLRQVYGESVATPFELRLGGATSRNNNYLHNRGNITEDWHTPVMVLGRGETDPKKTSVQEASLIRSQMGFGLISSIVLNNPNLKGRQLVISLEPLDPLTGTTIKDPQVLGSWNSDTSSIEPFESSNLTTDLYSSLKKKHPEEATWLHVRDGKSYLETEISGAPEKG